MADKKDPQLARRQFLQGLAAAPLMLTFGAASAQELDPSLQKARRVPMLQGWTDETESLIVVLGAAGWSFKSLSGNRIQVNVVKTQNISNTNYVLYRLQVTGLSTIAYSPIGIYDANGALLDTRSLKGIDLQMPSPRIAVASCANYRKLDLQEAMYNQVQQQSPDMIFFIGDIVYSNSRVSSVIGTPEDPSTALERYVQTWNTVNMYQLEPLIPTIAVWDDHDYGTNNGGANHPYKAVMKEMFRSFYPLPDQHSRLSLGPGTAFRLRAFGMDSYFMDGRSFFEKKKTQWGDAQEAWFAQDFNSSQLPVWLLNGIQFFRYFFTVESLQKSAEPSLLKLQTMLRNKKKPVALFSGDVHCSQVQEIPESFFGFKTYEITSSGIHSSSAGRAMHRKDDVNQLFYYGDENFLIVQPTVQNAIMDLEIRCATAGGTAPVVNRPLRIAV